MFSTGFIYKLDLAGSIEEFCWQTYGEYNEDLRNTVIQEFLRYWAKYDFYFYCYAYARIKNKEGGEDVPFLLRPAQVKLAETFERMRRRQAYPCHIVEGPPVGDPHAHRYTCHGYR